MEDRIGYGRFQTAYPQSDSSKTVFIHPIDLPLVIQGKAAIKAIGDRNKLFARESEGWKGYRVAQS